MVGMNMSAVWRAIGLVGCQYAAAQAVLEEMHSPRPMWDVDAIMADVDILNGRRRKRTLSRAEVVAAIQLRQRSKARVVRVWGGFVPLSYNKKFGALCPVLRLDNDGSWAVYLGSCARPYGRGNRFTQSNS
jgi:hypothetical protein